MTLEPGHDTLTERLYSYLPLHLLKSRNVGCHDLNEFINTEVIFLSDVLQHTDQIVQDNFIHNTLKEIQHDVRDTQH